jgi:hypothetical protein
MLQPVTPFVLGVGHGEIARRVAPRATLDGDNVQSGISEFMCENGAGPSQPNDDCILAWELARHFSVSLHITSCPAAAAVVRRKSL